MAFTDRLITSKKRASALSTALFLIGLAFLALTQNLWPLIMPVIGLPIALKQTLTGRFYDGIVTLIVFLGVYIASEFDIPWEIFLPVLFSLGAVYVLCKEFFSPEESSEAEKEEDKNKELEEEKK